MQEIKLTVNDENVETVLLILNNLRNGLIHEVKTPQKTHRNSQYKPKLNTIVREETSGTADTTGKYASASAYKQKLKKR